MSSESSACLLSGRSRGGVSYANSRNVDVDFGGAAAGLEEPESNPAGFNSFGIKKTFDAQGRIVRVETLSGVFHEFSYDQRGRLQMMQDRIGNKSFAVYKSSSDHTIVAVVKMGALHGIANSGLSGKNMSFGDSWDSIDPYTGGNLLDFYGTQGPLCALACIGILDSINNFVDNFANWLGVGSATYGTLGAIEGILTGARGVAVLTWFGLGALAGTAAVVAFTGGYLIGTGAYGVWTHIAYSDGRVVTLPSLPSAP
jgi:YD repeat-containing protein